jgi:PAS domain-containing protein
MADEGRLSEPPNGPASAPGDTWFGDDAAPARATVYWVLLLLLPLGGFALRGGSPLSWAPYLHLATETLSVALALVLGALSFVRYFTGRRRTFLFIGSGFVAAGALDASHAVSAVLGLAAGDPLATVDAAAWSWLQSRLFLAVFLLLSLLTFRSEPADGADRRSAAGVIALAAVLTLVTVGFFSFVQTQGTIAVRPGWFFPRPLEALPGALFAAVSLGYLRRGRWRYDAFEHWLVVSLLIAAAAHLFYMGFSSAAGEPLHIGANLLKVISYVALLVGVLVSVYTTAYREHRALKLIRSINERLEAEVEVRTEAEEVLQRSEARLRSFLDSAHDLVLSVDADGRLLYVNPAMHEALGYGEEGLAEKTLFDIVPRTSIAAFGRGSPRCSRAIASGGSSSTSRVRQASASRVRGASLDTRETARRSRLRASSETSARSEGPRTSWRRRARTSRRSSSPRGTRSGRSTVISASSRSTVDSPSRSRRERGANPGWGTGPRTCFRTRTWSGIASSTNVP